MLHIVCQDWMSTSGNHAGMVHLYKQITKLYPEKTRLYISNEGCKNPKGFNTLLILRDALKLCIHVKKGDKVLLTEYLARYAHQNLFVNLLSIFCPEVELYSMIHLTPGILNKEYTIEEIVNSAKRIKTNITLGSSLTNYLSGLGIHNVHTSFHYVDEKYYTPSQEKFENRSTPIRIIAMGALARNFSLLANIVKQVPEAKFVICKGRKQIDHLFEGCPNVQLLGFMEEDELKHQMDLADVSLNVMDDTIGSNVICTSLGMGLAMCVSDVGSIRDYCDDTNSVFCDNEEDFVKELKELANDPIRVSQMKKSAFESSKRLSIRNYADDIFKIIGIEK